jgi:hypothetical protein
LSDPCLRIAEATADDAADVRRDREDGQWAVERRLERDVDLHLAHSWPGARRVALRRRVSLIVACTLSSLRARIGASASQSALPAREREEPGVSAR